MGQGGDPGGAGLAGPGRLSPGGEGHHRRTASRSTDPFLADESRHSKHGASVLPRAGRGRGEVGGPPSQICTGRVHRTYAAPGSIAGTTVSVSRCGFAMGTLPITRRRRPHDHDC